MYLNVNMPHHLKKQQGYINKSDSKYIVTQYVFQINAVFCLLIKESWEKKSVSKSYQAAAVQLLQHWS